MMWVGFSSILAQCNDTILVTELFRHCTPTEPGDEEGMAPFPMLGRERGLGKGSGFKNWSGVPEPVIAAYRQLVDGVI